MGSDRAGAPGRAPGLPRGAPRHERRHRHGPARRPGRPGRRRRDLRAHPRRDAPARARDGAGRHPQGGSGPEHVHLLDGVRAADDGRRAGVVHRQRGAQLLQRLDQRLPHRRGRGEPDHAARVHARERLHHRRGVPRPRHGDRRLRAEPQLLLLERDGPGVQRDRPGRAPHLGPGAARPLRREPAQPDAQVPHPDLGAQPPRPGDRLQRHPHDAAGALRHPRQLQQPAHERLRRGDHDADRGIGAAGRRHPADHQPRVRARAVREPDAGVVRDRGAHRPRRGGGLRGVRAALRARRGARGDGHDVPAQQDPGREPLLRDPQARRLAPDRRREHLPRPRGASRRGGGDPADALDRGREGGADRRRPRVQRRARWTSARRPSSGCSRSRAAAATSSAS